MGIIERFQGRLTQHKKIVEEEKVISDKAYKQERLKLAKQKGIEKARAGGFRGKASKGLKQFSKRVSENNKKNEKGGYDPFNV